MMGSEKYFYHLNLVYFFMFSVFFITWKFLDPNMFLFVFLFLLVFITKNSNKNLLFVLGFKKHVILVFAYSFMITLKLNHSTLK